MSGCSDLDINCHVRKVLVRHWIDLGRISMRTTRGVVRLSGELRVLQNPKAQLSTPVILALLSEVKRIKNVRRVTTDFINWVYKDGSWQTLGAGTPIPQSVVIETTAAEPQGDRVYEIDDEGLPVEPQPQQS